MKTVSHPILDDGDYRYIDQGPSSDLTPVVLLHGMLGDVDNWSQTIDALAEEGYRVLVPVLPVYDMPMKQTNVQGLVDYVHGFFEMLGLSDVVLIGNSLGGQVALFFTLQYPESVAALILSGSSGIYEVEVGTSVLRRRDRNFIRERAAVTFYDPVHVTDALVDDAYDLVNDRGRALRLIRMARSAQSETVTHQLDQIAVPTLLVWGRNDAITPPDVAHQFQEALPHAVLRFIDECGHAPMIEHPQTFNEITLAFLRETIGTPALASSETR